MTRDDVKVGDEVKNGRSNKWALVVALDADEVTGAVTRLRVRRLKYPGTSETTPRWWPAASILMVERKR